MTDSVSPSVSRLFIIRADEEDTPQDEINPMLWKVRISQLLNALFPRYKKFLISFSLRIVASASFILSSGEHLKEPPSTVH